MLLDRRLLVFAAGIALSSLSSAAMLPLVAGELTRSAGRSANLVIAACIIAPQAVVAVLSPWVGRKASRWGRRPLLLLGFGAIPVRGLLLAVSVNPAVIVLVQTLEGISAAVVGVLLPLVAADLTRGTGRFNLCLGFLGLATGIGATLSTTLSGFVADGSGPHTALLALAAVGTANIALLAALPETDPDRTASKVVAEAGQR